MSAARYWHTLRYLRPGQIFGRIWFQTYRPATDSSPAPARRIPAVAWRMVEWREPALLGPDTMVCLGVAASVASARVWTDASRGQLWLYNLHYFDDLTSRECSGRRAWHENLIRRWIAENPAGIGPGWAPYPTSLRIANWIKWALASPASGPADPSMVESLAIQARWLSRRLEVHLLANHLWANAKALVFAGTFFDGPEADRWRRRGLGILSAELDEQILPDGGHFERSPMYHAIVLEDVLDLIQLSTVFPAVWPQPFIARLHAVAVRMLRWLRVMSHPDGQVSFFNDAAFDVAATSRVLAAYGEAVAVQVDHTALKPVEALRDSGYVRLENDRAVVFCDVAPVGPDYQPAHAHADTLSFELSVDGRRVVVNGGTSTYTPGPDRDRQRGTAAHSTVEVDGMNSTDVWAGFRVARRARPFDVRSGSTEGRLWAEGAHDGYRHRPGRVIHRRSWCLEADRLTVVDTIEGTCARAVARFLLHPDAAATPSRVTVIADPPAPIVRVPSSWHPRFGCSIDTQSLEIPVTGPRMATRLEWS